MKRELRAKLVSTIFKFPVLHSFQGRTTLLHDIPNVMSLNRNDANNHLDLLLLLDQLSELQLTSGDLALSIFIQNILNTAPGTQASTELMQLLQTFENEHNPPATTPFEISNTIPETTYSSTTQRPSLAIQQVSILCCYADSEESLIDPIVKNLQIAEKHFSLHIQKNRSQPGMNKEQETRQRIDNSHIILVGLSVDYLSEHTNELTYIQFVYQKYQKIIIPIRCRSCILEGTFLESLVSLPNGKYAQKSLSMLKNQDEATIAVVKHILSISANLLKTL